MVDWALYSQKYNRKVSKMIKILIDLFRRDAKFSHSDHVSSSLEFHFYVSKLLVRR